MLLGNLATSFPRGPGVSLVQAFSFKRGTRFLSSPFSASASAPSFPAFSHLVLELKDFRSWVCEAGDGRRNKNSQLCEFVACEMKLV